MRSNLSLPLATEAEVLALQRIAEGAPRNASIARVVAFGSRVRGDFRGDSDLDILVVVQSIEAREEVVAFLCGKEAALDVPLFPGHLHDRGVRAQQDHGKPLC